MPGESPAEGQLTMPSVILHEVGAHGAQRRFERPSGGRSGDSGMLQRGAQVSNLARARLQELEDSYVQEIGRLMNNEAMPFSEASKLYREIFPGYGQAKEQYKNISQQKVMDPDLGWKASSNPNYSGYHAGAGEAQARAMQRRAADLSDRLPMTDENYLWKGSPSLQKPLEGDVHPFQSYDTPPDLLEARTPTGYNPAYGLDYDTFKPSPGQFDWLLKKEMPAVAAGAGLGGMMLGGEAEAAPLPERFGSDADWRVQKARDDMAQMQAEQARLKGRNRFTGTEAYEPPASPSEIASDVYRALPSAGRSVLEETLAFPRTMANMNAGAIDWLGGKAGFDPGLSGMVDSYMPWPTAETVSGTTDALAEQMLSPENKAGLDEWTRHEATTPWGKGWGGMVEWGFDPLDYLPLGALAKLRKLF
jgi:hypothetical protein